MTNKVKATATVRVDTSNLILDTFEMYMSQNTRIILLWIILGARVCQILMIFFDVEMLKGNMHIVAPNLLMYAANFSNDTDRALFEKNTKFNNLAEGGNSWGNGITLWDLAINKLEMGMSKLCV